MLESFRELRIFCGVFGGEAGDAAGGFGVVVVEEERFAIGRGSEEAGVGMHHVALEFLELHVRGDICAQRTDGVGERGGAEAGMEFFGDGAAADEFAALENEGLEAAFGEVEGGDERVVTAADDYYALSDGHGQFFSTGDGEAMETSVGGCEERGAGRELEEDFAEFEREDLNPLLQSLRMTWLAMRPGAPIMPPPGCVAEPHI